MSDDKPADLDALEKLHRQATSGEWAKDGDWIAATDIHGCMKHVLPTVANSNAVVALHNAFPALAAELRRSREELNLLRGRTCGTCEHGFYGDCLRSVQAHCSDLDSWKQHCDCETFGNGCNAWEEKHG